MGVRFVYLVRCHICLMAEVDLGCRYPVTWVDSSGLLGLPSLLDHTFRPSRHSTHSHFEAFAVRPIRSLTLSHVDPLVYPEHSRQLYKLQRALYVGGEPRLVLPYT